MKLNPIGSNMNEVEVGGKSILFSYKTPVAGYDDKGAFRSEDYFSVTTSKHINKYLGGKDIGRKVPQSYIESLVQQMPGWLNTIIILGLTTLGVYLFYDTAVWPFEEPGEWDDLKYTLGAACIGFAFLLWRTNDE